MKNWSSNNIYAASSQTATFIKNFRKLSPFNSGKAKHREISVYDSEKASSTIERYKETLLGVRLR